MPIYHLEQRTIFEGNKSARHNSVRKNASFHRASSLGFEWHWMKVNHPVQYHALGMPGSPANSAAYLLPVDVGPFPQETTRVLLCFLKYSNRICSLERQNSYFRSGSICWACCLLNTGLAVKENWVGKAWCVFADMDCRKGSHTKLRKNAK